jgi:hypothetical protein
MINKEQQQINCKSSSLNDAGTDLFPVRGKIITMFQYYWIKLNKLRNFSPGFMKTDPGRQFCKNPKHA